MTGVLTKLEWTNPHVYINIDTTDPKTKKVTDWSFEMGPPHMLQKAGWKRNSLKIGETVIIDGWLARDGTNRRLGGLESASAAARMTPRHEK